MVTGYPQGKFPCTIHVWVVILSSVNYESLNSKTSQSQVSTSKTIMFWLQLA